MVATADVGPLTVSLSRFQTLAWDPARLTRVASIGLPNTTIAAGARYPFRVLRYWFMHELMLAAAREAGRPLRIAEVGVDHGQQLAFATRGVASGEDAPWWSCWDAFDAVPRHEELAREGYTAVIPVDIDRPEAVAAFAGRHYDIVIACHVLEHLFDPEAAAARMAALVAPGGWLIGGGPVLPDFVASMWEPRLRRTAKPFGHVSVLSPRRLERMARQAGLEPVWHSGAFAIRKRGLALEQQRWWLRANLAFGALFPGWPGEVYFAWRRAAARRL